MDMIVYDCFNRCVTVELPDKPIAFIDILVLSGNETGRVVFCDGTFIVFDSSNSRTIAIPDAFYTVSGENISKFINFKPSGKEFEDAWERMDLFLKDSDDDE